jgi:DNA-binding transcriptional LysR family regulator
MRTTHLRQADLNLLVVFTVLAEERNVSRAAARLLLSQPAVSRALQRLREMFRDDLLIRTSSGYELTPQGQRLLHELELMLPKLDRLLSGSTFDPATEAATFRIAATDFASHVLCPPLCRDALSVGGASGSAARGKVTFEFSPLQEGTLDALERGRLDLLLNADDGHIPAQFEREALFEEEFVCVVAKDSGYPRALTLEQYLAAPHIGVGILGVAQTIPEKRLAGAAVKRHVPIRVPYFTAAMRSVAGTRLIATVPRRIAEHDARDAALKIVKPPKVMSGFTYLMAWHPRMNTDAAHVWLRSTMRQIGKSIS